MQAYRFYAFFLVWGPTRPLLIDTFTNYELDLLQHTDSLLLHTDRDRLRLSFFDLRTGKVTPAAYLPADYDGIVNNDLYLYSRTIGPDGVRVYAFAASAELTIVDSLGSVRTVPAASRHLPPLSPSNAQPVEAQPTYGPVYYDAWRRCYYRFAYLPREPVPQNLNFNLAKDPVLLVLDEDFQPLGDFLLPPDRLVPDQAYVDPAGLWVSLAHPARTDLSSFPGAMPLARKCHPYGIGRNAPGYVPA